jgi:hypothetical protein
VPLATHIASPLLAEDRAVWRSVKALLHDVPELVPVAVCCTNHVVCAGSWLIMDKKSKIVSIFFMGWILNKLLFCSFLKLQKITTSNYLFD